MSDNATVIEPAADADTSTEANGNGTDDGSQGANNAAMTLDGLAEDNRQWVETKGFKAMDDIVKSAREAETLFGKSIRAPADDAAPEEWDAFYAKLGRPESPDAYAFSMPEDLSEGFPYKEEDAKAFAEWAHASGLNAKQADALHGQYVKHLDQQIQAAQTELVEKLNGATDRLVKEWGPQDGEGFKASIELAARTLNQTEGLADAFKRAGMLTAKGEITEPEVALFLADVGKKLFAEDKMGGKGDAGSAKSNPWKEGFENVTEQMRLAKTDPDTARQMILEVGQNPKRYGL